MFDSFISLVREIYDEEFVPLHRQSFQGMKRSVLYRPKK